MDVWAARPWVAWSRASLFHGVSAAVVAMFCYSTASLVPSLREAFWAPIGALVVLHPDRAATKKAAFQRFVGTALGSLIGWGSAAYWHQNVVLYGVAILMGVGLCYLVRLENAAPLCAVAVTVITLVPRQEPAQWIAFYRFVEVSYGVGCALVYTVVLDLVRRRWRRRRVPD